MGGGGGKLPLDCRIQVLGCMPQFMQGPPPPEAPVKVAQGTSSAQTPSAQILPTQGGGSGPDQQNQGGGSGPSQQNQGGGSAQNQQDQQNGGSSGTLNTDPLDRSEPDGTPFQNIPYQPVYQPGAPPGIPVAQAPDGTSFPTVTASAPPAPVAPVVNGTTTTGIGSGATTYAGTTSQPTTTYAGTPGGTGGTGVSQGTSTIQVASSGSSGGGATG
jgi:hypothetical protein